MWQPQSPVPNVQRRNGSSQHASRYQSRSSPFIRLRTNFSHEGCDSFDNAVQLLVCKHPASKIARCQLQARHCDFIVIGGEARFLKEFFRLLLQIVGIADKTSHFWLGPAGRRGESAGTLIARYGAQGQPNTM
jgi:hypothetical protein